MGIKPSEIYNIQLSKALRNSNIVIQIENKQDVGGCVQGGSKSSNVAGCVQGGIVFQPIPSFTFEPIITLDFNSMYVSIMNNI